MKRNATLREQAAIIYGIITGIKDLSTFYKIAKGNDKKIYTPESLKSMGHKLYKSEPVQEYIKQAEQIVKRFIQTQNANGGENKESESGGGGAFALNNVNFTDPEQFIKYLNNQANNLTEERDRREYLKMLSDLLRFKESGNSTNTEIQRFYTPLSCQNCQLYRQKADKLKG